MLKILKEQNISELSKKSGVSRSSIHRFISNKNDLGVKKVLNILRHIGYQVYLLKTPTDSTVDISIQIKNGVSWKIALFNFVDEFRRSKNPDLVKYPPVEDLDKKYQSLICSTTRYLCRELNIEAPLWCRRRHYILKDPWFVSEIKNLYATALIESPTEFRLNQIFVLDNFLSRV